MDGMARTDGSELAAYLRRLNRQPSFEHRLELASSFFLEQPYSTNPLGGSPTSKETLTWSLAGFDCVTYIETVLALAASSTARQFSTELRLTRYNRGTVNWFERNHYMTDWVRNNKRRGTVVDLTRGPETIAKTRRLDVVPGLQPRVTRFRCFPKRSFSKTRSRIRTGDVILFVSTRSRLDVFHAGVLIRNGPEVLLRHATRSAGKVVEQTLASFLANNRMSGFILLRPRCPH